VAALVDTNVLVDHLRGRGEATQLITSELVAAEPLFASVLTRIELLASARRSERPRIEQLLDVLVWVEVTTPIADRAGAFANRYARSHRAIDVTDYVIAATREELEVPLWTLNIRHFPMLPDLAAPYAAK
jgi:predicted nucleic acid-binding protein